MVYNYLRIFLPIIGLASNVLVQICIARYIPKTGLMKSIFLGFFAGFLTFVLLECHICSAQAFANKEAISVFIVHSIAYIFLSYGYFHFINLGETARRIRILRELNNSNNGLTLEEILRRYNARTIVDVRITRLVNNRQIVVKNGRYHIGKPIMLLAAKFLMVLKFVLLGKKANGELR